MLDSWSLRILVAVADSGSFSAAAEQLLLTQPAVSRQIAGLERQFGVPLFRRSPRGVSLTAAGEEAVRLARDVLAQLDVLEATMRSMTGIDGGELRLAGFASVNTHFVPEAIRRFSTEHPAVEVTLHHIDPFEVLTAVRDGDVDVALMTEWQLTDDPWAARGDPDHDRLDPDAIAGVAMTPLLDEELRVALPSDHRLAARGTVDLTELKGERWVEGAYPDCLGPLPLIADVLGEAPVISHFCDDWNGKHALVAAGAGITVVPTLAGVALRGDVVLRPTDPALPRRRLYAATGRPPFRSPAAGAMVALLESLAGASRS